MTKTELEAEAYRAIVQVNMWTAKLRELEQQIINLKEAEPVKTEEAID